MPIQVIPDRSGLRENSFASDLISYFEDNESSLCLGNCYVFYDFPILTNEDNTLLRASVLLISENKGLTLFGTTLARTGDVESIDTDDEILDELYSLIYSKLIKYRELRENRKELSFSFETILYAPGFDNYTGDLLSLAINRFGELKAVYKKIDNTINSNTINKIISIVDGSVVLPRPKLRKNVTSGSKGDLVNKLEAEITTFDNKQRHGYMQHNTGVQRIRGLAGSGKTVILAMKAALAHLENPNATILLTFYTKSLYQLVQ
ncbi:MAG: hypothetical protein QM579_10875 [Desulfovibrio sp.]|uniref:hypothetical protein n=1 Tax=Desulfovibrio sp. TaxID=885 RepID=UPI0039E3806F